MSSRVPAGRRSQFSHFDGTRETELKAESPPAQEAISEKEAAPGVVNDEQQKSKEITITAQEQETKEKKSSLMSKSIGLGRCILKALTFGNFIKLFIVSMLLPSLLPGGGETKENKENKPAYSLPNVQQHFMLEPVGFTYSSSSTSSRGYYDKDIAMWEALERHVYRKRLLVERIYQTKPKLTSTASEQDVLKTLEREQHFCPKTTAGAENITPPWTTDEFYGICASDTDEMRTQQPTKPQGSEADAPLPLQTNSGPVIVIDLRPGPQAQKEIKFLRDAVAFLVGMVRHRRAMDKSAGLEVLIALESTGGSISAYGLLAEQLRRLRTEPGITLTSSCDQNALSGGYLLASLASPGHLLAAPFASVGSIGVVTTEFLNFHDALENLGIKPIRFQGGQFKAPLTPFGDISEEEVEHMQEHIDSFHNAFRDHVEQWRGDTIQDYEMVTSGAYWMGTKAHELGLVDRVATSDEYIDEKVREGRRVLRLTSYRSSEEQKGIILRIIGFLLGAAKSAIHGKSHASELVAHDSGTHNNLVNGLQSVRDFVSDVIYFVESQEGKM